MTLLDKVNSLIDQLGYNPLYDEEPDIDIGELVEVLTLLKNKVYCLNCSREHRVSCLPCSIDSQIVEINYKINELERLLGLIL